MYLTTWALELTRFFPLLIIFGYAAYKDHKTGEVPNKIWLYAIIGGTITTIETYILFSAILAFLTVMIISASVVIGFLAFLLGGGGADSKAFMTLGLSAPFVPLWSLIWPIPLPFLAMLIACILALPILLLKKSDEPFRKRKIRFLPFMFVGLIVCVIL